MLTNILWIFVGSFVVSLCATPVVRRLARRFDLVDVPDGSRKLHRVGTPMGGGIAVFFAACLTLVFAWWLLPLNLNHEKVPPSALVHPLLGMFLSACIVIIIGIIDDRYTLRGRQKLAGQIVAALVLVVLGGLRVDQIAIWDHPFALGIVAIPFTVLWLIVAINAVNLIDGADGMASTVGIILSAAVGVMAVLTNHPIDAAIAFAVSGALAGFLIFNFPPATIFLGDAGSMLVGLILGALSIRCSLKGPATVALAAPLALMTIPFLDSTAAILRRILTGRSIYSTDRGHLHHCLLRSGLQHRTMLLLVASLCLITVSGAVASVYVKNELVAIFTVFVLVVLLITTRLFGHAEFKLVISYLVSLAESVVPIPQPKRQPRQVTVRLQGDRDWERIWEVLTDFAIRHELCYVKLDVNAAWMHEGYHASWRATEVPEERELWTTKLPIATETRIVGHLELWGACPDAASYPMLAVLAELLESLDDYIREIGSLAASPAGVLQVSEAPVLSEVYK